MKKPTSLLLGLLSISAATGCANDDADRSSARLEARDDSLVAECVTPAPGEVIAPVVEAKPLNLWPPNHKFHSISVADCIGVTAACDSDVVGEFIWASSDEPVDDIGDGHHAPDILLGADCGTVQLRSERQGPKDGRVYKLGVRVTDALGQVVESECAVIVDHDQRGLLGADSGESYRVTFDGIDGGLACDGEPDAPPATTPTAPPANEVPPSDDGPTFIQ